MGGIRLRGWRGGIETVAVAVAGLVFARGEVANEVADRRWGCKAVVGRHREGRVVFAAVVEQAVVEGCAAAEARE